MEQFSNFFLLPMDAWHHNMAGWFVGQLNNTFTQISIYYFYTLLMKIFIQPTLFCEHRLTFYQVSNIMLFNNGVNDLIMLLRIRSPMNMNPITKCVLFKFNQVVMKITEYIIFYLRCGLAQLLPICNLISSFIAFFPNEPKCLIMPVHPLHIAVEFLC